MESKFIENINRKKSPLYFLYNLWKNGAFVGDVSLEFSIYRSGGQGITLYRKMLRKNIADLPLIENIIEDLQEGEEFAVHSRIYIDNKVRYLPMADFSFINYEWDSTKLKMKQLKEYLQSTLLIYSSGHSYHMYGLHSMTLREWSKFMGFLLLLNEPEKPYLITDSRWVGHSLVQGFGALRLTSNSGFYLKEPILIDVIK